VVFSQITDTNSTGTSSAPISVAPPRAVPSMSVVTLKLVSKKVEVPALLATVSDGERWKSLLVASRNETVVEVIEFDPGAVQSSEIL